MAARLVTVFFYGLFMDPAVLERKGIRAVDRKIARLEGYRLALGTRATLVPDRSEWVYGMAMRVSAGDLEKLYSDASVRVYRPETVQVILDDGRRAKATCYNLPSAPERSEVNLEYARELGDLARRLGLPEEYLAKIEQAGSKRDA